MARAVWTAAVLAGALVLAACAAGPATSAPSSAGSGAGASSAAAPDPSPFAVRGVVEGFYGPAWTTGTTQAFLAFMGAQGMNTFVYAPKDDPYQRTDWSKPYPDAELVALRTLVQSASSHGVRFVYSVSPGLSITYSSASDRAALVAKLNQLRSIGVHAFMLSLDDIPQRLQHAADVSAYQGDLAAAQVDLANALLREERAADPSFTLMFTPTEYHGTQADQYLGTLQRLDPAIDVVWTGPGVVSPQIRLSDALAFGAIVGRKPIVWYNYPVNDWTVPSSELSGKLPEVQPRDLFMGPVQGLAPDLPQGVRGILANPMLEAGASKIPLASFAAYLNDPSGADVQAAWHRQIQAAGGGAAAALEVFVASERPYPDVTPKGQYVWTSTDPATDALEGQLLEAYAKSPATARGSATEAALRRTFQAWISAAPELTPAHLADATLASDIAPWVAVMANDGHAGLDALALLDADAAGKPAARAAVLRDLNLLSAQPVQFGGDLIGFLRKASAAAG